MAFSIGGEPPRLWWEDGPVTMSADQGLAEEQAAHKPGPDADAQNAAVTWLDTALADGPRPAKELTDEWINGEGGARRTLERARQALGVEAYRPENPGPWFWSLLSRYSTLLGQTAKHTAKTLKRKNLAIWAVCPKTRRICHFFEASQSTPPSCFILAVCPLNERNCTYG